jgi:hypothetical protein
MRTQGVNELACNFKDDQSFSVFFPVDLLVLKNPAEPTARESSVSAVPVLGAAIAQAIKQEAIEQTAPKKLFNLAVGA